jgi:hypothetical protein
MPSSLPESLKKKWMNGYETFRSAKPADGQERVLIPGDPETRSHREIYERRYKYCAGYPERPHDIALELEIPFE